MDDLIAALESVSSALADTWAGLEFERELGVVRAHIADLKAGGTSLPALLGYDAGVANERARVLAYARDFAGKVDCRGCPNMEPNVSINLLADAIASGAHMENNNAD